jgi:hypothetical protein
MKRKIAFFLFISFSATTIQAQQKVAEIPLEYKDPKFGKKENSVWLNYCRNSKQFILSVIQKDEVSHFLLNESMKVADNFSETREKIGDYVESYYYPKYLSKKNTLYGKQFRRIASSQWDSLTYVTMFSGEKNQALYFHLLDFSKKTSAYITSWSPEDEERIIGYYQVAGKLCWATLWGKKKKEFRFYELKRDFTIFHNHISPLSKQVDLSGFKADKLLADIAIIDSQEYPDNYEASRKIKLYPTEKGIYLTLNGRSPVTTFIFADAETGLISENIINHSTGNIPTEKIENSASFKYGNNLFLVSTSANQLFTTIYNLETGKIEKESALAGEQILMKDNQTEQSKKKKKEPEYFFEMLNKDDLFIKVKSNDKDIEVKIGSSSPVKFSNNPGMTWVPSAGGTGGYWISTPGPVDLTSDTERSLTYVFATAKMNTMSFENPGAAEVSEDVNKQSRVEYLIIGIRDPKGIAICKTGDIFYTGYYTEASGKYSIHKF